jgi:uncharacterized membrane protein
VISSGDQFILVTPTGTGWVDPAAIDSVEYPARRCRCERCPAIFLSRQLVVEPGYGADAERALFQEIYGY